MRIEHVEQGRPGPIELHSGGLYDPLVQSGLVHRASEDPSRRPDLTDRLAGQPEARAGFVIRCLRHINIIEDRGSGARLAKQNAAALVGATTLAAEKVVDDVGCGVVRSLRANEVRQEG